MHGVSRKGCRVHMLCLGLDLNLGPRVDGHLPTRRDARPRPLDRGLPGLQRQPGALGPVINSMHSCEQPQPLVPNCHIFESSSK